MTMSAARKMYTIVRFTEPKSTGNSKSSRIDSGMHNGCSVGLQLNARITSTRVPFPYL